MISNNHKNIFPGLKKAAVIFSVYLVLDFGYKQATKPALQIDPSALRWSKEVGEKPVLEE